MRMNDYNGVGMIKQIPATKRYWVNKNYSAYSRIHSFMKGHIYRGKNENGGRKIPSNTIGAAVRRTSLMPRWERGIEYRDDVGVLFVIADGKFVLAPMPMEVKGRLR